MNYQSELLDFFNKKKLISFSDCLEDKIDSKILSLSNNYSILKLIPRNFTITTNNGSCNFNIDLIQNSSFVIYQQLIEDPKIMEYNLDINDEENILEKFGQLYQGEYVTFNEDELLFCQKITKLLQIKRCPNFMLIESLKQHQNAQNYNNIKGKSKYTVHLLQCDLNQFLNDDDMRSFIIKTNNQKYECSTLGIYSSDVLRKLLTENPTIYEYEYDYDDSFNQFQFICDYFNSKPINLTRNNVYSIKEIAEDLQITLIMEQIDNFICNLEKVSQQIDEQQKIIDSINNLFDLLYNIKELTVEKVKMSIITSEWSKTEDGVKELVAFILQVIKTDYTLHQYMLDLILQLDQEADESNKLDILMNFLIKQLLSVFNMKNYSTNQNYLSLMNSMFNFFNNPNNAFKSIIYSSQQSIAPFYAFIYKLYKKGIITKQLLYKNLENSINQINYFLYLWFLPEMMEIEPDSRLLENSHYYYNNKNCNEIRIESFIDSFLPDKIDLYKKIRDFGEPEDEITRSLRNDDIDTFQKIVSKFNCDIQKLVVPFNMYENYIINGETNYINYAAAYGSVKCFKYLLLNQGEIDKTTFSHAVFGQNIEIIKIVDQIEKSNKCKSNESYSCYSSNKEIEISLYSQKINQIIPTIMKHKNDLFDWILEQRFSDQDQNDIFLILIDCSLYNGNVHSLFEIFDKRLNSHDDYFYINVMKKSALNGFYNLAKLMFNFVETNSQKHFDFYSSLYCFLSFENISILDLLMKFATESDLELSLIISIKYQFVNIAKCIYQELLKYQLSSSIIFKALYNSIQLETNEIFYYLMEQVIINDPIFFIKNRENNYKTQYYGDFNYVKSIDSLLNEACNYRNIEASKYLTEFIIDNKIQFDYTACFRNSAASNSLEMCKYFVEKNLKINYELISSNINDLGLIDEELFNLILSNISPEAKENMYSILDIAIKKKNNNLVKILLKEKHEYDDELILAVLTDDLELVNIILDHNSQPHFINKISNNGTALTIAALNNNLGIVKRLLSLPGINPNLYDNKGKTPLMNAIRNFNIGIFNALVDFYGENIESYKWQIEIAVKSYLLPSYESTEKKTNKAKINSMLIRIFEIKFINFEPLLNFNTLLTYACSMNNIELVLQLLKNDDIDVNLYELNNGDTPFIISIKNNNLDLVNILIDHPKININQKNFTNESPLMIAVIQNNYEIIDIILNSEKFNPDESSFNYTFFKSTGKASIQLITSKYPLDVNYKNFDDDNYYWMIDKHSKVSTLIRALHHDDVEKIDLIFQHPSFDKSKSQFTKAIKESIELKKLSIFNKLMELVDDINMIQFNGNSLLCIAECPELITAIINNKSFDPKKSDILKAFNRYFSGDFKSKIAILSLLYEYDKEHDNSIDLNRLLENGHSYFTEMGDDVDLYDFLLLHDADPNMPDKFGIYPLQYAINIENFRLVSILLDSEKIDYNKKIQMTIKNDQSVSKESTFLHLAASKNHYIFMRILNKNWFDINVTNDLGETPLIIACRFKQSGNIINLFENNNLDYLHHDNSGKNALNYVFPESINQPIIDDKKQYRDLLLNKL